MKIRIQGSTVRIRVNDREVKELCNGEMLLSETWIPDSTLRFELLSGAENRVNFQNSSIIIVVSSEELEKWARTDEITIALSFDSGQDKKLSILVEKDMKE